MAKDAMIVEEHDVEITFPTYEAMNKILNSVNCVENLESICLKRAKSAVGTRYMELQPKKGKARDARSSVVKYWMVG